MDKVSTVETDEPILAAGGIVWRCDPNPTVAIVHRKRHGGDWVLPKGKSEPGEGLRATALREAVEETGCAVTAHELLGSISYEANGRRKIVHFWRMEAGEPVQAIDSEVDQVRWLPLEAAVDALTYPQESDFLRSTVKNGVTFGWLGSIPLRHRFFETSTARLRKATTSLQIDLRRVIGRAGAEQNWTYDAWLLIDRVRRAIEERDAGLGWQCHKHADRLRLHGLGEQELRLTAQRLVNEAEKLPSWRSNTVKQILLEDGHLKSSISAIEVAEAARLVHENEDNTYRRLRLRSLQFAFLGIAALIFLTCYTALVRFSGPNGDLGTWAGIAEVSLLGALGAAVSGILRIGSDKSAPRIPIELSAFGFLIARLMVGAATALLIVAVWQSGFISFANIHEDKLEMALAFAAGFTERLAQNAIEKLVRTGQ